MPTRRRDIALRLNAAKSGTSRLFTELPYLKALLISPTAAAMAKNIAKHWQIRLRDLDTAPCDIDINTATIWLNSKGLSPLSIMRSRFYSKTLALSFLCALRASWHATQPHDLYSQHNPALWPHIARILAADTASFAVHMAHEVMAQGRDESLWRFCLGEDIGDIANHYANTRKTSSIDSALLAAHTRWYACTARINLSDANILDAMDKAALTNTQMQQNTLNQAVIAQTLITPVSRRIYLQDNLVLHDMPDPINRQHFARILDDMSLTRIGNLAVRDADLARRLLTTF